MDFEQVKTSDQPSGSAPGGESPWMRFVGLVESGDLSSSQTVDRVIYGADSSHSRGAVPRGPGSSTRAFGGLKRTTHEPR